MKIILGSASPRRREILSGFFTDLQLFAPDADESLLPDELPSDYASRISLEKGLITLKSTSPPAPSLIISCDTIVTMENRIFGKPADRKHAAEILGSLCGKTHKVITALTLIVRSDNSDKTISDAEISRVTFKHLKAAEIESYLDATDYSDKAGSYAFQQNRSMIIEKFAGSATNIIGFPLRLFFRLTSDAGITDKIFRPN
jgi:septum formation protein